MHRLRSTPFPEGAKDSTSQYGIKLRSTFLVHGREYDSGCRDARSGCVNSILQVKLLRSHSLALRVLNVYSTYGQSGILLAAMCRVSMTWSPPSSKCSCPHTSVGLLLQPLLVVDSHRLSDTDPEDFDTALLTDNIRMAVEADTFWCLSRLLDGIQDNYIAGQPGIHRSVKRMAELVARIDGLSVSPVSCAMHPDVVSFSPIIGPFGRRKRRIHAIRIPVDELPSHARNQCAEHHPNVGYLSGAFPRQSSCSIFVNVWNARPKGRMRSPSFTCMSAPLSWYGGARSCRKWTSRWVYAICLPHDNVTHRHTCRASSCSYSRCPRKTGETTRSKCFSARRSSTTRHGTTPRATSANDTS